MRIAGYHPQAIGVLVFSFLLLVLLIGLYFTSSTVGRWTPLFGIFVLLATTIVAHKRDRSKHWGGFLDFYDAHHGRIANPKDFAPNVITRLSIHAALAVALGVLLATRCPPNVELDLFSRQSATSSMDMIRHYAASPETILFAGVIVDLVLAILFILVAILCYDYALRFVWENEHIGSEITRRFIRNANGFDKQGFYTLTTSILGISALYSPALGFVAMIATLYLLWKYYFLQSDSNPGRGEMMKTHYIMLCKLSPAGKANISQTVNTLRGMSTAPANLTVYVTLGDYDLVVVCEDDDIKVTKYVLAVSQSERDISDVSTMRAFTDVQYDRNLKP